MPPDPPLPSSKAAGAKVGKTTTLAVVALVVVAVLSGCGGDDPAPVSAGPITVAPAESSRSSGGAADIENNLRLVRALTDALNRGDATGARECFAPTARFDSVGRIYPDRDAIFGQFLEPEVIGAGGRYTELSNKIEGDRLVVEYNFTTTGGGREHFTYAYRIEQGLITDVIGKYV